MEQQWIVYFIYFCIFVIGLILGRVTMAIQYEVMKPAKRQEGEQPEMGDARFGKKR